EPTYLALMAEFEAGAFDLPGFHARFRDATGSRPDLDTFRETFLGAVKERPAAYDLVAAMPPDVKLGMLSNNVAEPCDRVRADPRLGRLSAFVFSNEVRVRKPDAAAYAALLAALGEEAGDVVFVDDNAANVAAANELGLVGVLLDADFPRRWREAVPGLALPPELAAADWSWARPPSGGAAVPAGHLPRWTPARHGGPATGRPLPDDDGGALGGAR